ncbi:MAG: hypothetical protein V4603_10315 [Pseudomonadota bacterium]
MKTSVTLLLSSALAAQSLHAEAPVFRDNVLSINEAIVFNAQGPAYYGDVRMQANKDGTFSLVQAQRHNLALIDTVDVLINKSNPVQVEVNITGIQSVACVALLDPVVTRSGNAFTIVQAETLMEPGSVCMSLLAVTPFSRDIPLEVEGLAPGVYTVSVNGKQTSFTL